MIVRSAPALVFSLFAVLLLATDVYVAHAQLPPDAFVTASALQMLGFNSAIHQIRVVVNNTNLTEWFGAPPPTGTPMTTDMPDGPDPGFDVNSNFLASVVSSYCFDNGSACGFSETGSRNITTILNEPDNVGYVNTTFEADSTATVLAFFRIPVSLNASLNESLVDPSARLLLPANVIIAAIDHRYDIFCQGMTNISVRYITYATESGSIMRTAGCPAPTVPATTQAATTPAAATTNAVMSTAASTNAQGMSSMATSMAQAPSSSAATMAPSTAAPSTAAPSTAAATSAPTTVPPTTRPQTFTVAIFQIAGIDNETFYDNVEAIEEEASQVVIGNCSLQSSMPPTGSPSGPTNPITVGAVERISNGVEFALHFTSPAGVTVSCSGASTESTLDAQLQDIFEESFVVDQLQAVLSNGTITLRSLTTTAATTTEGESDKGLSTGAIVGIAVGGGVAAFILIIIIAVIISYGCKPAPLQKTNSTRRIMPASEGAMRQEPMKEAWRESNQGHMAVEEYQA